MAAGKFAKGMCQRCSFVFKLSALRRDGDTNLMVCAPCYDIEHPAEEPFDSSDNPTLASPAPDIEAAQTVPTALAASLGLASGEYFGGGT